MSTNFMRESSSIFTSGSETQKKSDMIARIEIVE